MTKDGSEMPTWTGQGIAHLLGNKRSDGGSVFCRTFSTGRLAFLSNIVGVFEYEANLQDGTAEEGFGNGNSGSSSSGIHG